MSVAAGFSTIKTAISALQTAASVVGNNIANATTEGYTRQKTVLTEALSINYGYGEVGTGVKVETIARVRDKYLDKQYVSENSDLNYWTTVESSMTQIESMFGESKKGTAFGGLITDMQNAWDALATSPDDASTRTALIQASEALTAGFNDLSDSLTTHQSDLENGISIQVSDMNGLIKTIADYNAKIVEAESTGDQANSLRDARELAVDKLAKLTDFKVFEEDNGSYSLSSGSVTFVTRDDYMTINTGLDSKTGFTTMTWSGTSKSFAPASGSIGAILNMRDVTIPSYLDKIDTLAGAIADQTNALHVYGRGLEDLTESASTNAVASTTAALTSAASGLTKPVTAGDVTVTRVDAGGTETATTITVGATTTLADLATQFSAAGLTATANSDGTLSLASASGESFYFSKSAGTASNMLSSLGINTFFTGSTAGDIGVNTAVVDNVALVAAGASSADADNTVAQEIADLRTNSSVANESTFERYYASSIIGTVGTEASTASRNVENQTISVNQLKDSIDSVSSVSTDEEVTNLTLLQQALTACARYVTALSTMMDDILNMV